VLYFAFASDGGFLGARRLRASALALRDRFDARGYVVRGADSAAGYDAAAARVRRAVAHREAPRCSCPSYCDDFAALRCAVHGAEVA